MSDILSDKNPPGRHKAVTRVREVCREINGCMDPDELMALLHTPEMQSLAFEIAHTYPGDWEGPEANCGLMGTVLQMGGILGCASETKAWVRHVNLRVKNSPF